jgi:hypothetical protein
MALIIKRFKTALKGRKEHPNKSKTKGKRSCFKCGKTGHFIANCPDNESDQEQERNGPRGHAFHPNQGREIAPEETRRRPQATPQCIPHCH